MTTFYVNGAAGDDAHDGLTPAAAFRTVQRAIGAARADVDMIVLSAGSYPADPLIGTRASIKIDGDDE